MTIKTSDRNTWIVTAEWFGAQRIVFESVDIFAAIRFVANN